MAKFKHQVRQDDGTYVWTDLPLATNDAKEVVTTNPLLVRNQTEDETGSGTVTLKSVEQKLLEHENSIELLRKNVSWCALHGGSGSGGGTGGSIVVHMLNPDNESEDITSLIWNSNITQLKYKIESTSVTRFQTVKVMKNGTLDSTQYNVTRQNVHTIDVSKWNLTTDTTVQLIVTDDADTEYYGTLSITCATVKLSDFQKTTITQAAMSQKPTVPIVYSTNIMGKYRLYYSTSNITYKNGIWQDQSGKNLSDESQYVELSVNSSRTSTINFCLTYPHETDEQAGTYFISPTTDPGTTLLVYFVLVNEDKPDQVFSPAKSCNITIITTDGMIISPSIGLTEEEPYMVFQGGQFELPFIVYSSSTGRYSYTITTNSGATLATGRDIIFGNTEKAIISLSTSPGNQMSEVGETYRVNINVSYGVLTESKTIYIGIKSTSVSPLYAYEDGLTDTLVYDFSMWKYSGVDFSNNSYTYTTKTLKRTLDASPITYDTTVKFYNIGSESGHSAPKYNLHHKAYGVISSGKYSWWATGYHMNSNNTSLICGPGDGPVDDWTIELAYYVDREVDDSATIFNIGDFDPEDNTGEGILITAHKYYISMFGSRLTGDIQDNGFTQLDIVYTGHNNTIYGKDSPTFLQIYQNGILLNSVQIVFSNGGYSSYSLGNKKTAYIGCRSVSSTGEVNYNINLDLYCVKMYISRLNPGQICCSYINNYVHWKDYNNGISSSVLNSLLEANKIKADSQVKKDESTGKYLQSDICDIYDLTDKGGFKWGVTAEGEKQIKLGDTLSSYPIPVVTINIPNWDYPSFMTAGQAINDDASATFTYYEKEKTAVSNSCTVGLQGTTSRGYCCKNLSVTFNDGVLFSPKDTWFPENSFTLKADVVDSGHLNNASIGTFVNDCFKSDSNLMDKSVSCFPTYSTVETLKQNSEIPNNMSVKPSIEGFPVVLVLSMKNSSGQREAYVMGIYSFNLGRDSYYNQGLKVAKKIYGLNGNPIDVNTQTYPAFFQSVTNDDTYDAWCFEGKDTFNPSTTQMGFDEKQSNYTYLNIKKHKNGLEINTSYPSRTTNNNGYAYCDDEYILDYDGQKIPWDEEHIQKMRVNPDGFFWSTDPTYSDGHLWDSTYASNTNLSQQEFTKLNQSVASMPYSRHNLIYGDGATVSQYKIKSDIDENFETTPTGSTFTIQSPQSQENISFNAQNTAFYYVICMLFGLVDNMGKNMQWKQWYRSGSETYWNPTFYDMDTGNGLDNSGAESISTTCWDNMMINFANKVMQLYGDSDESETSITTVYGNKIWGILEIPLVYQKWNIASGGLASEDDPFIYSNMWSRLRTTVIPSAEKLFDDYFASQVKNVGILLYNYDFETKYFGLALPDNSKLHGNRLSFIKNWLEDRIAFLDSMFGYNYSTNSTVSTHDWIQAKDDSYLRDAGSNCVITPYNVHWNNKVKITHNSGSLTMPVKTNRPVIVRTHIGGTTYNYKFLPKNTELPVQVANSTSGNAIQVEINNSDCIIELPGLVKLKTTNITAMPGVIVKNTDGSSVYDSSLVSSYPSIYQQQGSLSSLKILDLDNSSGVSTLDFFSLFKSWDSSGYGEDPEPFSLQYVHLKNVSSNSMTVDLSGTQYTGAPSIYKSPFTNILGVDVSGSSIPAVLIPDGVSLYELLISNSSIQTLTLTNQTLLSSLDFNGCGNLNTLNIAGCSKFETFNVTSNVKSIQNITLTSMSGLKSFNMNVGGMLTYVPNVTLDGCSNLTSISISYANGDTLNADKTLQVWNCPKLTSIAVTYSNYSNICIDNTFTGSLNTLNLNNSTVRKIYYQTDSSETQENNGLNLSHFSSNVLKNLYCQSNNSVKYVTFNNVKSSGYFNIGTSWAFSGCTNLKRVYGYVGIGANYIFSGCSSFSIHGEDENNTISRCPSTWNGFSIIDSDNRVKHPVELSGAINESTMLMKFNESSYSTNMILTSGVGVFRYTSCTIWDVYYILYNLVDATDLNSLFYGCLHTIFNITNNSDGTCANNSPHRNMFLKCSKVSGISGIFWGDCGRMVLPSGNEDGIGNVPLPGAGDLYGLFDYFGESLKSIRAAFSGSYIVDKQIFVNSNLKNVSDISYFYPVAVVNDTNADIDGQSILNTYNATLSTSTTAGFNGTVKAGGYYPWPQGDLSGFFKNLPSITSMAGVFSKVHYVDYSKFESTSLGIPKGVTVLQSVLRSSYANGTLDFNNLLEDPSTLQYLWNSITVGSKTNDSTPLTLTVDLASNDKGLFDSLTNLIDIGYADANTTPKDHVTTDFYGSAEFGSTSLTGNGITKTISSDSFPYGLFSTNQKRLRKCISLFNNCTAPNFTEIAAFPTNDSGSSLFDDCTSLEDITMIMYNVKFPYKLTGNGFQNCASLTIVTKAFGCDITSVSSSNITSPEGVSNGYAPSMLGQDMSGGMSTVSIPFKLFYHGDKQTVSTTITGTDFTVSVPVKAGQSKSTATWTTDSTVSSVWGSDGETGTYNTDTGYWTRTKIDTETWTTYKTDVDSTSYSDSDPIITISPTTTIRNYTKTTTTTQQATGTEAGATGSWSDVSSKDSTTSTIGTMPFLSDNIYTYKLTYTEPNRNIKYASCCFQGANLAEANQDDDYEFENMSTYQPFKYVKTGSTWGKKTPDYYAWTGMYTYDGDPNRYDEIDKPEEQEQLTSTTGKNTMMISKLYYIPDKLITDPISHSFVKKKGLCSGNSTSEPESNNDLIVTLSGRYCTPGDFCRYFAPSASVQYMFDGCGVYNPQSNYVGSYFSNRMTWGLKGRLCPYMLHPLTSTSDFTGMFRNCKWIGGYCSSDYSQTYMIPDNFFEAQNENNSISVMTLNEMFAGWGMPWGTQIDAFEAINKQINIQGIFNRCFWSYRDADYTSHSTKYSLTGIFNGSKTIVNTMRSAFAWFNPSQSTYSTYSYFVLPVKFGNTFNAKYTKGGSNTDYYVFAGWGTGTEFGTKTVRTDDTFRNYALI